MEFDLDNSGDIGMIRHDQSCFCLFVCYIVITHHCVLLSI